MFNRMAFDHKFRVLLLLTVLCLNFHYSANMKREEPSHSVELHTMQDAIGNKEPCICGKPNDEPSSYIIGGNETTPHEFPWMVAVTVMNASIGFCGGVLINDFYVLTVAHCVRGYIQNPEYIYLIFGAHNRRKANEPPAFRVQAERIIVHPAYDLNLNNDIALTRLVDQVTFSHVAWPICLPVEGDDYVGKIGTMAGWGSTIAGQNHPPDNLVKVQVPIQPAERCMTEQNHTLSTLLCVFSDEEEKGSCGGDSGGPLMLKTETEWELIGLVSWGVSCGLPGLPAACTRVNQYLEWLSTEMTDANYCSRKNIAT